MAVLTVSSSEAPVGSGTRRIRRPVYSHRVTVSTYATFP